MCSYREFYSKISKNVIFSGKIGKNRKNFQIFNNPNPNPNPKSIGNIKIHFLFSIFQIFQIFNNPNPNPNPNPKSIGNIKIHFLSKLRWKILIFEDVMSFSIFTNLQGHWPGFTKLVVGTFQKKAVTFEGIKLEPLNFAILCLI